jgi:hypothetical protein
MMRSHPEDLLSSALNAVCEQHPSIRPLSGTEKPFSQAYFFKMGIGICLK